MNAPEPLIIIGAGEHARVVADAVSLMPERWQLIGIAAPDGESWATEMGVRWFVNDAAASAMPSAARFVLGVGQVGISMVRERLVAQYDQAGAAWATVRHPSAIVSPSAVIASGVVILAGAVVNPGAEIGAHAIINTRAVIEHDCHIGRYACIAPGVVIGGGVSIGDAAFIGLGACLRDHITIGTSALIGMGAVVTSDVPDNVTVVGHPARPLNLPSKT